MSTKEGKKNTSHKSIKVGKLNLAFYTIFVFVYLRRQKNVKKSLDNFENVTMLSDEERDIDVESDDDGR